MTNLWKATTVFVIMIYASIVIVDAADQQRYLRTPTPPTRRRYRLTTPEPSHKGRVQGLTPIPPFYERLERGLHSAESLIPPQVCTKNTCKRRFTSPSPIIEREKFKSDRPKVLVPQTNAGHLQQKQPRASAHTIEKARFLSP